MKIAITIASLCILILLALAGILIFDIGRPTPSYATINSYTDCANAGYPISQTYPEQCSTPDGRSFTQNVATSSAPTATDTQSISTTSEIVSTSSSRTTHASTATSTASTSITVTNFH